MNKYNIVAPLVAVALIAGVALPGAAFAQNGNNATNTNGKAYGHFIAPGWIKNNVLKDLPDDLRELPNGIRMLIEKWRDGDTDEDTTDPVISGVNADATADAAVITWETDEDTKGKLYISTSTPVDKDADDTIVLSSNTWDTDHELTAEDLEEDTEYHFLIVAKDRSGNDTEVTGHFTTDEADDEDTTAPMISSIATDANTDSVTVTWNTNESADSHLYISTSSPVDVNDDETLHTMSNTLVMNHSLMIDELEDDTTYYGIVVSKDAAGNTATSSTFSFTTDEIEEDTTDPIISNLGINADNDSAVITWNTNESATSKVYYSTASGFDPSDVSIDTEADASLKTDHSLELTGLTSGSIYFIIVESVDASGNVAQTGHFLLMTDND